MLKNQPSNPVKIQTEATEWSCEHEKHAVEKHGHLMKEKHLNVVIRDSAFYIAFFIFFFFHFIKLFTITQIQY